MNETVYISFSKNTLTDKRNIKLSDVAKIFCQNSGIQSQLKDMQLLVIPDKKRGQYVITALKVINMINQKYNNLDVNVLGATEFIVTYKENLNRSKVCDYVKVFFISVIVFFGGAFAIMAYGNDININNVIEKISGYIVDSSKGELWLSMAYSVGLSVGIIVFYNHLPIRRAKKEPTPLEVQMKIYEEDINNAVISESIRKKEAKDVD